MAVPEKVTKRVRIDFQGAKGEIKEAIKKKVGEFIVEQTNKHLDRAESPVEDGEYKRNLQRKKGQKGATKLSKLFEEGDLRANISFEEYRDGIEVGVFNSNEAPKAYGHNTGFKGHPFLSDKGYIREFVPKKHQEYNETIKQGIIEIVEDILSSEEKN